MFLATASPRVFGTLVDALLSTLHLARALSLIKRPPPETPESGIVPLLAEMC